MYSGANKYLGRGIYSVPDAARLLQVTSRNIRRWVLGYQDYSTKASHPPVIVPDYEPIDSEPVLSFLDLIELRFVTAFRDYGVSLQEIRRASEIAAKLVDNQHPFATKRFYTDRKRILAEIIRDGTDLELLSLVKRQYEIRDVVLPVLHEGIDFSEFDLARRWWPMGKKAGVVVDPAKSFGRPIVSRSGVPTDVLAQAVAVQGSIHEVMLWYEVQEEDVRAAVEFENTFAA